MRRRSKEEESVGEEVRWMDGQMDISMRWMRHAEERAYQHIYQQSI